MNDTYEPRELTEDKIRAKLLDSFRSSIDYWLNESRAGSERRRMEGLVHTILSTLDGSSIGLPKFIIAPDPHPDDKAYLQSEGEDWYPEQPDIDIQCDLGGTLHEYWYK